ncbi:MAG: hypothetical protein ABFE01_15000 [Phycisphaerales bacterium]
MPTPILEQIAQWHYAMIASITEANGYAQTLGATRPEELQLAGDATTDLTAVCAIGNSAMEDVANEDAEHFCWQVQFDCVVTILGKGTTSTVVDTRITQIIADIHRRIGTELLTADMSKHAPYCGGLAYDIRPLPWEIVVDTATQATLVSIPVRISFEVSKTNPYSQ